MKRPGRRKVLLGLATMLAGCTTEQKVVTQSNAAGVSNQKLRRVLIAISVRRARMTESQNLSLLQVEELKRSFEAKWPPLGISIEIVDVDGAPDNGGQLVAAAYARFRAGQLLYLQTSTVKFRNDFVNEYEIDAVLYDAATRKRIWRASTQLPEFWRSSTKYPFMETQRPAAADRYVDSLTEKLREDGLL
jgi:hypothetical protein